MTGRRKVVIAGATGVVGLSCVERFAANGDWDVVALARRGIDPRPGVRHISADLRDEDGLEETLAALGPVSHLVYAAVYEKPGLIAGWTERDQMETNDRMLRNLVGALQKQGALQHVTLLQGTKAYGAHLHAIPVPAREGLPRDPHENFYWLQEDFIRQEAARTGLGWTIWRPQLILGGAIGVAMNLIPVIGVFGALCRELDRPFGFPGGPDFVWEAVDARILAEAIEWAADAPEASGEIFNITNGDVFSWRDSWSSIAEALGLEPVADAPLELGTWLPAMQAEWEALARRHGLREPRMAAMIGQSHFYADRCFATGRTDPLPARLVSTIKLRKAGFGAVCDTADTFRYWLGRLAAERYLPDVKG